MNVLTSVTGLDHKLRLDGPKRILVCDGEGILGLINVKIPAQLEGDLCAFRSRSEPGQPRRDLALREGAFGEAVTPNELFGLVTSALGAH